MATAPSIFRLRMALRDLVALSAIPAAWVGREPPAIAAGLADVLAGSLRLDFAFVRLYDPGGGAAVEAARGNVWKAFPEWLGRRLGAGQFSRKEIIPDVGGAGPCRGIVIPVGVNAEGGLVAAACERADFPTEIDQLLLSVAANHAATASQNSRLIQERRSAEQALRRSELGLRQARDELEVKVAERTAELRRSETYLAEAQRLSHTGSWSFSPATREVIHWSEEQSRIFGFDPEGGVPSVEEQTRRIHPEDRDRVLETVDRAVRERIDYAVDSRVVLPDGTMKYIHSVGHPVSDASGDLVEYIGTTVDMTERRRAEEVLRERADLLDLTHDTVFARDMDDVITYWNRGAEELYGWKKEEAVGQVTHRLTRTVFPAPLAEINEELLGTGRWEGELVHTKRDGARVVVASRWSLQRDERGNPAAILETNNDITERRRAEEALQKAQAELAHVTRVTTMGELTSSIAHEVNQPLAAIVTNGNATLRWLASDPPNLDEARESVGRIVRDGHRASEVVGRVRALFRKTATDKARLDVNALIRDVIALVRGELHRNQVLLRTELAPDPPPVLGDRVQLQQVLLNLIVNGIEAMSTVTGRSRDLLVRTRRDEAGGVTVSVRDSGVGIEPQHIDRLFDAFYTTKAEGMGMGLSISRSIIEAHDGRLWATPNDGHGATFKFTLQACSMQE